MEFIEPDLKTGLSKRLFPFEIHRMVTKRRFSKMNSLKHTTIRELKDPLYN